MANRKKHHIVFFLLCAFPTQKKARDSLSCPVVTIASFHYPFDQPSVYSLSLHFLLLSSLLWFCVVFGNWIWNRKFYSLSIEPPSICLCQAFAHPRPFAFPNPLPQVEYSSLAWSMHTQRWLDVFFTKDSLVQSLIDTTGSLFVCILPFQIKRGVDVTKRQTTNYNCSVRKHEAIFFVPFGINQGMVILPRII